MPASGAVYGPAHRKVPGRPGGRGQLGGARLRPRLGPRGPRLDPRGPRLDHRVTGAARARHRRWLRLRRSGLRRSGLGRASEAGWGEAGCDAAACESSAAHGASPAGGGVSTKSDPSTDEGGPVGPDGSASGSEDVTTFSGSPAMDTATTVVHNNAPPTASPRTPTGPGREAPPSRRSRSATDHCDDDVPRRCVPTMLTSRRWRGRCISILPTAPTRNLAGQRRAASETVPFLPQHHVAHPLLLTSQHLGRPGERADTSACLRPHLIDLGGVEQPQRGRVLGDLDAVVDDQHRDAGGRGLGRERVDLGGAARVQDAGPPDVDRPDPVRGARGPRWRRSPGRAVRCRRPAAAPSRGCSARMRRISPSLCSRAPMRKRLPRPGPQSVSSSGPNGKPRSAMNSSSISCRFHGLVDR